MSKITKILEKLQKSLAKADGKVFNLADYAKKKPEAVAPTADNEYQGSNPNVRASLDKINRIMGELKAMTAKAQGQATEHAPAPISQLPVKAKPAIDVRSRNEKIKDALAAQGKVDDRMVNGKAGENFRDEGDAPLSSKEDVQSRAEEATQELEDKGKDKARRDVREKEKEDRIKLLAELHGPSGEYAAPFYRKMLSEEKPAEEHVPGMPRRVSYLGESPKGHMFSVSGNARGERGHLFEVSGEGKKPEFTRYPTLPHAWDLDDPAHARASDAETAKHAHLAIKSIKYSKAFKNLFPEAGKYTEHGEYHPKDFSAEYRRSGWAHTKLSDNLGYSDNSVAVRGRNKAGRTFNVIQAQKFEPGQLGTMGNRMEHPAYVVLPWSTNEAGKEEHRKIFETVMKHPKIAEQFPHGYKFVDHPSDAHKEIKKLAFQVVKSFNFMDILRKSTMKNNEIPGGKAAGMAPKDFTPTEQNVIKEGAKVENDEHGSHGTEIAMDHVAEMGPSYYDKLKHMERTIKKSVGQGDLAKGTWVGNPDKSGGGAPGLAMSEKAAPEFLSKPPVSEAQRKAMFAAAAGHSNIGIPKKVGKEFADADKGGKLPEKIEKAAKPATHGELADSPVPPSYGTIPNLAHHEAIDLATKHSKVAQNYAAQGNKESAAFHHGESVKYWNHGQKVKAAAPMKKADPVATPTPPIDAAKGAAASASFTGANSTAIDRGVSAVKGMFGLGKSAPMPASVTPKIPTPSAVPMSKKIDVGSHVRQGKVVTTDGFAKKGLEKAMPEYTVPVVENVKVQPAPKKTVENVVVQPAAAKPMAKAEGDVYDKALQAHQAHGGSTFCFQKGDLSGHPLFAVGVHPNRTQHLDHPISKQDLMAFHGKNKDLFSQEGHVLGTWHDPDTKRDMMDIVKVTPHESEARELGKQHGQKAIFNLGQRKTMLLDKSIPIPPVTKSQDFGEEGEPIQGKPVKVSSNIMKNLKAKATMNWHSEDAGQTSSESSQEMIAGVPKMAVPPVAVVPPKKVAPMKVADLPTAPSETVRPTKKSDSLG